MAEVVSELELPEFDITESGEFFLRARQTAFPGREIAEMFGITGGRLAEQIDANILNLTGDRHRRLRALVASAFTPRAAARWRPVMQDIAAALWQDLAGRTECEFVSWFAGPFPARTIGAVIGAPALRLFAGHPGQWEALRQRPELVGRAVDEVLRFEPITPFTARLCTEQIEHRGVIFPAGTIVAVCAERANRETGAGDEFDITAEPSGDRVLTFGAGAHFCLGQNLARAELEEALSFLAPGLPGLRPGGSERLGGVEGIYGIESLPLAWTMAR